MRKLLTTMVALSFLAFSAIAGATTIYANTATGALTGDMGGLTTAYGELLTLPTTQALQSFSFYLTNQGLGVAGNIDLEIANWNSTLNAATGPIVYSSPTPSYWNAGTQILTFNNINTLLQGDTNYVVYMTLATPGSTTQSLIANPANYISAYEGTSTSFSSNMVWANSNGIDPLYDSSSWITPKIQGWSPTTAFQFSATTTTALISSSASAAVPAPSSTLLALLAILGFGFLTSRRKIS